MVNVQEVLTAAVEFSTLFGLAVVGYGIVKSALRVGATQVEAVVTSPSEDVGSGCSESEHAAYVAPANSVEQVPDQPEVVKSVVPVVEPVAPVVPADWCEYTADERLLVDRLLLSVQMEVELVEVVFEYTVVVAAPEEEERGSGRMTEAEVDAMSPKEWTMLLTQAGVHAAGKMALKRRRNEMIKHFVAVKEAALV